MTQPLWTEEELCQALDSTPARLATPIDGISIDSRQIKKNDLFLALKGPQHDGHLHVQEAFEKGATTAIIEENHPNVPEGLKERCYEVCDVTQALNDLAQTARKRLKEKARVISITGSVGKTGSKSMLSEILSHVGSVHMSEGNLNNHFGLPLSLARMRADSDFGIFEAGSNQPGDIAPLASLARAHLALLTIVQPVHIGNFTDMNALALEKSSIFNDLSPPSIALLPGDGSFFDFLSEEARKKGALHQASFGQKEGVDYQLCGLESGFPFSTVSAKISGRKQQFQLAIPGTHWAMIAVSILGIADLLKIDSEQIIEGFKKITPLPGRGEMIRLSFGKINDILLIDESYNASPIAVEAALSTLLTHKHRPGRRILVLGDMLELGNQAEALHLSLKPAIEEAHIDKIFTAGPLSEVLFDALPTDLRGAKAKTSQELIAPLLDDLQTGDTVLVKGSAGSQTGVIVKTFREKASGCPDAVLNKERENFHV